MRCARAGSRCRRTEVPGLRDPGPAPAAGVAAPKRPTAALALTAAQLSARLAEEAGQLQGEADEIELLISQARTEAQRHEARRQAAADKLATAASAAAAGNKDPKELVEL